MPWSTAVTMNRGAHALVARRRHVVVGSHVHTNAILSPVTILLKFLKTAEDDSIDIGGPFYFYA